MKRVACVAIAMTALSLVTSAADASTILFNLGTQVVSASPGDNLPVSESLPSVGTVRFTDIGNQTVEMTIQAGLEAGNEYFTHLLFNGSTASDANHPRNQDLVFTQSGTSGLFASPAAVVKSNDAQTINPPGGFDFKVIFGNNTVASRFDGTDSLTYTITCGLASSCGALGFNPLDALDFNVVNAHNDLGLYAVVALGYVTPGQSGDNNGARYGDNTGADNVPAAATVPEPATMLLLGAGLVAFGSRARKAGGKK